MENTEYLKGLNYELDIETEVVQAKVITKESEEGNAFYLLGLATMLCPIYKLEAEEIVFELTRSDYENLVRRFNYYFSDFVRVV